MIEYKHNESKNWFKISARTTLSELLFNGYCVRIQGEIFTENSVAFRLAWERNELWSKIKGE